MWPPGSSATPVAPVNRGRVMRGRLYWKDRLRRVVRRGFITNIVEHAILVGLLALTVVWVWILLEAGQTIHEWLNWTTIQGG